MTKIGPIPVTTATRTLIDLAAVTPAEIIEDALDDALRRRLVTLAGLDTRLKELARSRRPGVAVIRSLLAARDPFSLTRSKFESLFFKELKKAGLPKPDLQYPVRDGETSVAIIDFAYPRLQVALETDGFLFHSGRAKWDRDLVRHNKLTALGWRVVHISWTEFMTDRRAMIDRIARTMTKAMRQH